MTYTNFVILIFVRIRYITGLESLTKLDVLDLHGNLVGQTHVWAVDFFICSQIRDISNLSYLIHLRVLNLAGNDISVVEDLNGLLSLAELNLRRNKITHVSLMSTNTYHILISSKFKLHTMINYLTFY